jgi:hypothetical protein
MNKRAHLKRIEALESRTNSTLITFVMADKSRQAIKRERLLEICTEAVNGIRSLETETLLSSVSDNSDTKIIELLQMLF